MNAREKARSVWEDIYVWKWNNIININNNKYNNININYININNNIWLMI